MLADVAELVAIPSWGGTEGPAQIFVAGLLESAGCDVDVWEIPLPTVKQHPHASWEIERESALGVVGTLRGTGGGPALALNGHVDVVPPGDEARWTSDPWTVNVREGLAYGRGTLDMKGPLLAGLHALRAVRGAGVTLRGDLSLMSVIGEEDGGIGTLATLMRGHTADAAICMEPTALHIGTSQAGCLNFRITVPGLGAHGALRDEGVSAIEKAHLVHQGIRQFEARRNAPAHTEGVFAEYDLPFPISIGRIEGGSWASSVPESVQMEGRYGIRPDESFESARGAFEAAVHETCRRDDFLSTHPARVEWWGGRFLSTTCPSDHTIIPILQETSTAASGQAARTIGVPFGADAGLLAEVGGIPTVLFGAGDIRRAHGVDEHVAVADLVAMSRALAVTAVRYCAVGP